MLAVHNPTSGPMVDVSNVDYQFNDTLADSSLLTESRICPGCQKSLVTENGGVVVAFGQSFFHVDCFKCAKCANQVTADTNLLLLSDGSPICENCSYSCNVCHQPILDEAIMTGDDSYHAHCFKCKVCKKRIDELVFAKTSQGIYCMECHNQRVARSRRHAQRQREKAQERERQKELEKLTGGESADSSANSREDLSRNQQLNERSPLPRAPTTMSPDAYSPSDSTSTSPQVEINSVPGSSVIRSVDQEGGTKRGSTSQLVPGNSDQAHGRQDQTSQSNPSSPVPATLPSIAATLGLSKRFSTLPVARPASPSVWVSQTVPAGLPAEQTGKDMRSVSSPVIAADSLAVPSDGDGADRPLHARRSFDVGVRGLSPPLRPSPSTHSLNTASSNLSNGSSPGLGVPNGDSARRDKRRSINPAVALSFTHSLPNPASGPPSSFLSLTSPVQGRESPRATSPLRELFSPQHTMSPPSYVTDITASPGRVASSSSRPGTPSSLRGPSELHDQLAGRNRSGSSSTYHSALAMEHLQNSRTPSRQSATLDRFPSRPDSRADQRSLHTSQDNSPTSTHPLSLKSNGIRGRRPPSLNLNGSSIRTQKSFDDRARASPSPSLRQFQNSNRSSNSAELELPLQSGGPTSPSHRVDVPHGIESETDTEVDSEAERSAERQQSEPEDLPPALPPKESQLTRQNTRAPAARPPLLWLNTADMSDMSSETGHGSSEEGTLDSPESSPVERTSHATFIAPALPPIRISMGGTDFSDLLRSVGGNVLKLEQLAETTEDGGLRLDLSSPAVLRSRRNSYQIPTPRSDVTIMESPEIDVDDTPVKRPDGAHQRARNGSTVRESESPTPTSPSSLQDRTVVRSPTEFERESSPEVSSDGFHATERRRAGTDYAPRSPSALSQHQDSRPSLDTRPRPRAANNLSHAYTEADHLAGTRITVTSPDSLALKTLRQDKADQVRRQLQDAVVNAAANDEVQVVMTLELAETVLSILDQRRDEYNDMKRELSGFKRASQQYMNGMSVAHTEYDRELKARRDAESEVTRLRVLLSGQAVRLSAISGDSKRQEAQRQISQEIHDNLSTLERTVSKLKVERDMTLAEVEQLSASRSSPTMVDNEDGAASMSRALSMRFDNIKSQYQHELIPLTQERETLMREIQELRVSRDAFLEETTMLNARNEELAQLHAQYVRRVEGPGELFNGQHEYGKQEPGLLNRGEGMLDRQASIRFAPPSLTSSSTTTITCTDEAVENKYVKVVKPEISRPEMIDTHGPQFMPKFRKWGGGTKAPKEINHLLPDIHRQPKAHKEHAFQQVSVLRVARCDHCSDKMWGSQSRCTSCNIAVHTRCIQALKHACSQTHNRDGALQALSPPLFGRELIEQVHADSRNELHLVPVIVEKCIDAVDTLALDYEGIYRKTGGSGQSKMITQLFERGDYNAFDLRDTDRFNDICSVTSVLKTYFRCLPDPLLTYALHDRFIAAAMLRDPSAKSKALTELVNELPKEHYHTLGALMLHLHRVSQRSDTNLMHARNIGVVFGPTLMRSRDPNAEFTDMAGKALSVEWLVENAPAVFDLPH